MWRPYQGCLRTQKTELVGEKALKAIGAKAICVQKAILMVVNEPPSKIAAVKRRPPFPRWVTDGNAFDHKRINAHIHTHTDTLNMKCTWQCVRARYFAMIFLHRIARRILSEKRFWWFQHNPTIWYLYVNQSSYLGMKRNDEKPIKHS